MEIIAKLNWLKSHFKISPQSASSMINAPLDLKFTQLDDLMSYLSSLNLVSNLVHYKSIDRSYSELTRRQCEIAFKSERIMEDDIHAAFENHSIELHEADNAFFAIESSCLIRDRHKYHAKTVRCQIHNRIWKFYFDIKKTFKWQVW